MIPPCTDYLGKRSVCVLKSEGAHRLQQLSKRSYTERDLYISAILRSCSISRIICDIHCECHRLLKRHVKLVRFESVHSERARIYYVRACVYILRIDIAPYIRMRHTELRSRFFRTHACSLEHRSHRPVKYIYFFVEINRHRISPLF